jgi:hypothetical protein
VRSEKLEVRRAWSEGGGWEGGSNGDAKGWWGRGNGLLELRKCDMGYPGAVGCIGNQDR